MNCHNPLALAAVPPLQFHLAGLLQGMEAAGFTVPNAGGKGGRGAGQGLHWGQAYPGSGSGQLSGSCGEDMGVGKASFQGRRTVLWAVPPAWPLSLGRHQ